MGGHACLEVCELVGKVICYCVTVRGMRPCGVVQGMSASLCEVVPRVRRGRKETGVQRLRKTWLSRRNKTETSAHVTEGQSRGEISFKYFGGRRDKGDSVHFGGNA